jgi:hypothetical protein
MEEVEGQNADDTRRRRQPEPPYDRYNDHAQQVHHTERALGSDDLERI